MAGRRRGRYPPEYRERIVELVRTARSRGLWPGSSRGVRTRIHAALLADGERACRKRVARLMRELGIVGLTRRRFKTGTTKRDAKNQPSVKAGQVHSWMTGKTFCRSYSLQYDRQPILVIMRDRHPFLRPSAMSSRRWNTNRAGRRP